MTEIRRVALKGLGRFLPEKVLTNFDLEKNVDTSDEWISTRTGIKERHIAADDETTSQMSTKASKMAMEQAGISGQELDMILLGTVSGDFRFPATACIVQKNIEAVNASAADLGAGCSGFIYGLYNTYAQIAIGAINNGLVIGAEKLSALIDWTDRSTCVLFADGAGAAVIGEYTDENDHEVLSVVIASDGSQWDKLWGSTGLPKLSAYDNLQRTDMENQYICMDGNDIFKNAVRSISDVSLKALEKANLTIDDVTWMVPHQANIRILTSVAKKLKFPEDKVFVNLNKYGNISAGSIPVALSEAQEQFKKGDVIVSAAFGAGVTYGATVIRW